VIDKIGFFHFVEESTYAEPMTALREAIKKRPEGYVNESLIVLPEGFNIGGPYMRNKPGLRPNTDPIILFNLQELCRDFKFSLVAGLIVNMPNGPDPPYSSAYLINSDGFGLLCHKRCGDETGIGGQRLHIGYESNYTCCSDGCDAHNAFLYRDSAIVSLMCMDAYTDGVDKPEENRQCHQRLRNALDGFSNSAVRIVCVPAHMQYGSDTLAMQWPNSFVILANRCHAPLTGPGSFVAQVQAGLPGQSRIVQKWHEADNENVVKVLGVETRRTTIGTFTGLLS
jgi:hypothetical protein